MKNLFYRELTQELTDIEISGEAHHHFKNVIRGKVKEAVQIFNGQGLVAQGTVSSLSKINMIISLEQIDLKEPYENVELILGIPKKEYLESILRSAIQIGVSQVSLINTDFTPWKFKMYERLNKIMESALIQSENPYLPVIKEFNSLEDLLKDKKNQRILCFSTETDEDLQLETPYHSLLVGPEGGFSLNEIELLKNSENVVLQRCNIPIMKAEVAVPFGLGHLYNQHNKKSD
ncbi:MAG: hypothetical protein CME63_00900 [Halobacteriovoraceae bacterium]|nr:hypothetical protein [Halobacteriovoraceae bacterium]|tara:strand:+ start:35225 stop:35923 length:699 start_codon:yes stop_codon:yes gene_type:complete